MLFLDLENLCVYVKCVFIVKPMIPSFQLCLHYKILIRSY